MTGEQRVSARSKLINLLLAMAAIALCRTSDFMSHSC
jgi:hypothetical protein